MEEAENVVSKMAVLYMNRSRELAMTVISSGYKVQPPEPRYRICSPPHNPYTASAATNAGRSLVLILRLPGHLGQPEAGRRRPTHGASASPVYPFTTQKADRTRPRALSGLTRPRPRRLGPPAWHHLQPARHACPTLASRVRRAKRSCES